MINGNYCSVSSSDSSETKCCALDTALDYVQDITKEEPKAIIGYYNELDWIDSWQENYFDDNKLYKINSEGFIGNYNKIPIFKYHVNKDNNMSNKIMVIGNSNKSEDIYCIEIIK